MPYPEWLQGPPAMAEGDLLQVPAERDHTEPTDVPTHRQRYVREYAFSGALFELLASDGTPESRIPVRELRDSYGRAFR